MHLKGEGLAQPNATRAIELYSEAANQGSVKALNGLGYIYFNGQGGVAKNMVSLLSLFTS
jgi:TPR repeat protein